MVSLCGSGGAGGWGGWGAEHLSLDGQPMCCPGFESLAGGWGRGGEEGKQEEECVEGHGNGGRRGVEGGEMGLVEVSNKL